MVKRIVLLLCKVGVPVFNSSCHKASNAKTLVSDLGPEVSSMKVPSVVLVPSVSPRGARPVWPIIRVTAGTLELVRRLIENSVAW